MRNPYYPIAALNAVFALYLGYVSLMDTSAQFGAIALFNATSAIIAFRQARKG